MVGASRAPPNGTAESAPAEVSSLPPVIGINFGNTYASIAVFTKEGFAESIANEDGDRQIACAIAFHGEEIYIGNQAKHQLVKNASNTIVGFRDLLGKRFSEINFENQRRLGSALVIQHPELAGEPAYRVDILQPAPTPLSLTTTNVSAAQTPAASYAPTPRSEPIPATRFISVSEVTTLFLQYLVQTASDFLGKAILGSVISIPSHFSEIQKEALLKAAEDAGIPVLQLLDETSAIASATIPEIWTSSADLRPDRTQLIVDFGVSSLFLALLSYRESLAHVLALASHSDVNGRQIDDKLIGYFAKDFTKKSKVPLQVCPAGQVTEKRAEAKLRLAVEHTKRTLSASPGAAACSVESLCNGLDYTGSINRMRFDMEMRPIYIVVSSKIRDLLAAAGVDPEYVDEIVYVGGITCLPGLNEHLCFECGLGETVVTPFSSGTITGGGIGDPTEILARGCALQAELLHSIREEDIRIQQAFKDGSEWANVHTTGRSVALFPGRSSSNGDNVDQEGIWVCIIPKETSLPTRRAIIFDVDLPEGSRKFILEVWEVTEGIRMDKFTKTPTGEENSDGEEMDEELEARTKLITKNQCLGTFELEAKAAVKARGQWKTTVEVLMVSDGLDEFRVVVREIGKGGTTGEHRIAVYKASL